MNEAYDRRHKRAHSLSREDGYSQDVKRHRSGSPHRHKTHHGERSKSHKPRLPFHAAYLHKSDFAAYRALFADYLDLQKQLDIDELTSDEARGRWKSFLGKWNRGELAEGWYDPEAKARAEQRVTTSSEQRISHEKAVVKRKPRKAQSDEDDEDEVEDDGYGPALPTAHRHKSGPSIPSLQDLEHRRELAMEDRDARRSALRAERKQDRVVQKERLEELAPRAEPGSRERQLEKKRDAAMVNRVFKDAKDSGEHEVGDAELMGDDGIDSYKAQAKVMEKRKNEREIRKEEMLRARAAEREEKIAVHRMKEEKTMDMLKALARQRFGGDDGAGGESF